MAAKFNKGDVVRRTGGSHRNMVAGDIDVVTYCQSNNSGMDLEKFGDGHDPKKFELVKDGVDTPKVTTLGDLEYIRGDKYQLIEEEFGVSAGTSAKIFKERGDKVELEVWGGRFKKTNLKVLEQDPNHLRDVRINRPRDYSELKTGDQVALVDFGWGVGEHRGIKVGDLGEVMSDWHGDHDNRVKVRFPNVPEEVAMVSRVCLRKVIKPTKEKPMAKLSKSPTGVVEEYKGLDKPTTIIEQQIHVNRVLRDFKRRLSGAVWVCGGAPRNWDHGRMANDIDVYFFMRGSKALFVKAQIASYLGIQRDDIIKLGCQSDAYYGLNGIKFVYQVKLAGQVYQFIVMDSPVENRVEDVVLSSFNCDICKIAWDPINEEYLRTTEYKTDRDMKRLTYRMYLLEESNAKLSMERHLPKMMKQFPQHTVVIYQEAPRNL